MSLDNLLVLLALALLSAAPAWLAKRRSRKETSHRPDEAEPPLSPGTQGRSNRKLDWEEVLRQLLGGEPSPQAPPPPPIPSAWREEPASRVGSDEESFEPQPTGQSETRKSYEGASEQVNPTVAPLRPRASSAYATAAFDEFSERQEKGTRHFEKFHAPSKHSAVVASNRHCRRSGEGARAVALVCNARTVRQAFIASQVLSQPKAMES